MAICLATMVGVEMLIAVCIILYLVVKLILNFINRKKNLSRVEPQPVQDINSGDANDSPVNAKRLRKPVKEIRLAPNQAILENTPDIMNQEGDAMNNDVEGIFSSPPVFSKGMQPKIEPVLKQGKLKRLNKSSPRQSNIPGKNAQSILSKSSLRRDDLP